MNYNEYLPKDKSSPFSFRISTEDKNLFQRLYPYCLSRFIKLCIKKAVQDKQFFNDIFFSEVK